MRAPTSRTQLSCMLRWTDVAERFVTLSATKTMVYFSLEKLDLAYKDEDGWVKLTEKGDTLLDNIDMAFEGLVKTL